MPKQTLYSPQREKGTQQAQERRKKGSRKKDSHLMPVVEESVGPGDEDGPPGTHRVIVAAEMQACGAIGRQPNRVRSGVGKQQQRQEEDGGEGGAEGGAAHRDVSCRVRSAAGLNEEAGVRRTFYKRLDSWNVAHDDPVAHVLKVVLFLMD